MDKHSPKQNNKNVHLALSLSGVVLVMVALSFAAVPLYQMFCQVTGYGGTTQRAQKSPDKVLAKTIRVRFDANVSPGVHWRFKPEQKTVDIKIGQSALVFYKAQNLAKTATTGTASFNVTPEAAGYYFNKIECFCFTNQTLEPGQEIDMPVSFFIDPEIASDPDAKHIEEITLSYTFFPSTKEDKTANSDGSKIKKDEEKSSEGS